jgi:hypothetical protein
MVIQLLGLTYTEIIITFVSFVVLLPPPPQKKMFLKLLKYSFEKGRSKAAFMNSKVARVRLKSLRNIQNALPKTRQDLSLISCTAIVLIKGILRKYHKYT